MSANCMWVCLSKGETDESESESMRVREYESVRVEESQNGSEQGGLYKYQAPIDGSCTHLFDLD
jgi:LmbE family N-acetylglucosaminyl deacetylase